MLLQKAPWPEREQLFLWEENERSLPPFEKAMPGPGATTKGGWFYFGNGGGRETSLLPSVLHAGKCAWLPVQNR